jgi:hypothetical protein
MEFWGSTLFGIPYYLGLSRQSCAASQGPCRLGQYLGVSTLHRHALGATLNFHILQEMFIRVALARADALVTILIDSE